MYKEIDDIGELYTEHETAKLLKISVQKLRKDRWEGKGLKFRKFGSAVRYSEKDIVAYVNASLRHSTTDTGGQNDA